MATSIIGGKPKREGNGNIRIDSEGLPIYECMYSFIVKATDKEEPYLSVLGTSGIPIPGVTLDPSGFAVCHSISGNRRVDNPLIWDVVANFRSDISESAGSSDHTTDPVAWVPVYETKFERLQEVVTKDLDDNPVANSAGQQFETGLTIGRFIPVWEFYQFEAASVTDEEIIDRNETINSGTFKGRPAKTLLLTVLSSTVGFFYGTQRRLTMYSIKYNSRKWTHKRLDIGTIYKDGSETFVYTKKIKDEDEEVPISGPLDGSGGKAADGDGPAILEFEIYPELSFGSFLRT